MGMSNAMNVGPDARRAWPRRSRHKLPSVNLSPVRAVADGHVPDDVFAAARAHFSEEELVDLTLAIVAINGWNRLSIAFRPEVGKYQPGMFKARKTA
jgi:hypothetical protein